MRQKKLRREGIATNECEHFLEISFRECVTTRNIEVGTFLFSVIY